ncbi:hypothetical protein AX769_03150 [Frondihabitans sp. PAMC 28766]|uniref:hypothetical protein n=1 Tax=Frondihabitans sp. PAMC 28766 TaxID=1795630 RepID=UPI00078D7B48|nr:hypothetical protein [Frondihabitans sp. PAMC 28766]AMM19311.1 hypothetical protein AX769_03150 [Frondihabitans sp. PAMC 28766]
MRGTRRTGIVATAAATIACAALVLTACSSGSVTTQPTPRPSGSKTSFVITTRDGADPGHLSGTPQQQALELASLVHPSMSQATLDLHSPALSQSWSRPGCTGLVHDTRMWIVDGISVSGLAEQFAANPLPGYRVQTGQSLQTGRIYSEVDETQPPTEPFGPSPTLQLTMARLPDGGVGLRADAYVPGPTSTCAHTEPMQRTTPTPTP